MKLPVDLSGLINLRKSMGADERVWMAEAALADIHETRLKLEQGVSAQLDEIETSSGLLSYKSQQIAIYIKDHTNKHRKYGDVLENPEHGNRVHIFDCSTLQQMRREGRFERYVQTIETKKFAVDVNGYSGVNTEFVDLKVCMNCLKSLKYRGYQGGKTDVWKYFDLAEFFAEYSTFFAMPAKFNDFASPSYQYTKNWSEISRSKRSNANWTCSNSSCGAVFSNRTHQQYLHVHHRNGVKSDNHSKNLEVLCLLCHAKEPSHQHMVVPSEAREIIEHLRRQKKASSKTGL